MKQNWASTKKVNARHGYAEPVLADRHRRKRRPSENKPRAKMGKATPHPLAAR